MDDVTLSRGEWAAVARDLDATSAWNEPSGPPGLRERIAALLADTPAAWAEQRCTLALDPPAAATVRAIVRRGRDEPAHPERRVEAAEAIAAAAAIVRDHQAGAAVYRIEHRTEVAVATVGHSSAADAGQAELSSHAARLIARGATGELVLVDQATGQDVARRRLLPDPAGGPPPDPADGAR